MILCDFNIGTSVISNFEWFVEFQWESWSVFGVMNMSYKLSF